MSRLKLVAKTRDSDYFSRIGGNEFVYILEIYHDISELIIASKRLLDTVNQPINWNKQTFRISCSIGIACYPDDTADIDELIEQADSAMYKAKQKGKNTYVFINESITTV